MAAVDPADDVLKVRGLGPEEFAGLPIERVDDAGLARDAGEHLAHLAGLMFGVDPRHLAGGRHLGVDEDAIERVVEVPMIDDVLVVPHDLAGVGVQSQRRGVVEIGLVVAGQQNFGVGPVTEVPK